MNEIRAGVDLPRAIVRLEAVEQRLGGVLPCPLHRRFVRHEARGGPCRPERAVHERLRGDLGEPVVEHAEGPGDPVEHRHLLGRVAGHDLRVLLIGGLAADLAGERADVVGDEALHARLGACRRDVPRGRDGLADLEAVVLFEDVVELRVRVVVLLARVGVRGVHIGRDGVGDRLALGAVLGPLRDRVGEVLADHALEALPVLGPVQVAEHVVEGAVLKQDEDDMVHRVRAIMAHRASPLLVCVGSGLGGRSWDSVNSAPCPAPDPEAPPPRPRRTNAIPTATTAPAIGPATYTR